MSAGTIEHEFLHAVGVWHTQVLSLTSVNVHCNGNHAFSALSAWVGQEINDRFKEINNNTLRDTAYHVAKLQDNNISPAHFMYKIDLDQYVMSDSAEELSSDAGKKYSLKEGKEI